MGHKSKLTMYFLRSYTKLVLAIGILALIVSSLSHRRMTIFKN